MTHLLLLILLVLAPAGLPAPGAPSISGATPGSVAAPELKWQNGGCRSTWCRTGWYASPAVADLDGNGTAEVIWSDYRIVAVNGADGSDRWIVNNPGGGRAWPAPALADFDLDGRPEIVTAHSGGWIAVTRGDGTSVPGWPVQPTPGAELRSLAVGDADNDGYPEVLVASTRSDDQWFLYDQTGAVHPGWPRFSGDGDANGYAAGCYNQNVGLADLDGDARLEIVGPNDTHYVAAFRADGSPLRANPLYGLIGGQPKVWARVGFHYSHEVDLRGYANCQAGQEPLEPRPNFADSAPGFADMDGDGVKEIVIIGNQYDCRADPYQSLYQSPYILRADRTRWSAAGFDWTALPEPDAAAAPKSEDWQRIETALPNPVLVDLEGDGRREILFSSYDGRLHATWLDKTEHGAWPYSFQRTGESFLRFGSEPVVADLDGDGFAEVLVATWTEKGSNAGGQLLMLGWDGVLLHAVDLPRSTEDWDGSLAAPTLADIDRDGELEAVLGAAHTGLVAYDLPGTARARVLWGTGRGAFARSGASPAAAHTASARTFLPWIRR